LLAVLGQCHTKQDCALAAWLFLNSLFDMYGMERVCVCCGACVWCVCGMVLSYYTMVPYSCTLNVCVNLEIWTDVHISFC
jgi:hypothetical protein